MCDNAGTRYTTDKVSRAASVTQITGRKGETSAGVAYSEFSEFKDHDRALFVAPVALTPHVVLRSHHSFRHWGLLFCAPSYTAISLEILSLHGHIPFCVESRGGPSSFYEGMAFHARALRWIHNSLLPRKTSAKL